MAIKYIKWPKNRPNGHKIYKHIALRGLHKSRQIAIFGLKIYHLATPAVTLVVGIEFSSIRFSASRHLAVISSSNLHVLLPLPISPYLIHIKTRFQSRLPDFSSYNVPKWGKYNK
jgi:hypothetical protein